MPPFFAADWFLVRFLSLAGFFPAFLTKLEPVFSNCSLMLFSTFCRGDCSFTSIILISLCFVQKSESASHLCRESESPATVQPMGSDPIYRVLRLSCVWTSELKYGNASRRNPM